MKTLLLEILQDVWWHWKNWLLMMLLALPPGLLLAWLRQPRPMDTDPLQWLAIAPGVGFGLVRAWCYNNQRRKERQ